MIDFLHKLKVVAGWTLGTCAVVGCTLSVLPGSPLKPGLMASLVFLQGIPWIWGAALFTLLQTLAVVMALPATPFNLAAGYMFTVWLGSVVSLVSLYAAAICSFLVGRFLARSWAEDQIEKRPAFKAIDAAVATNGFYIVFIVTLAPVFPSGVCYYLFGITNVGFWSYLFATALGLIPGTVALTYLGSLMSDLADIYKDPQASEDPTQQFLWVGIAVVTTIATLILLAMATRRTLFQVVQQQEAGRGKYKDCEDPCNIAVE
mmetsp:Transcript_31642/g.56802  ORF Transcript_31642/g.56802 Transcript_31642/m.56802 type:complete len:261 (-) Transcript_31642:18-800(-)